MKNIQLIVPMAGLGTRFTEKGYKIPKPILPIGSQRMIEIVLQNLTSHHVEKVVVVTKTEISESSSLPKLLTNFQCKVEIILVNETTEGPASTCFLAKNHIDLNKPLVIANSDQYLDTDISVQYENWDGADSDGLIWAMEDNSPKWSFVRTSDEGRALEIREKIVISKFATCGVYAFSKASDFFDAYLEMVHVNDRTNNEFYVAPTYNYLISRGKNIRVINLGPARTVMHGLGIPEDYEAFLASGIPDKLQIKNHKF